MLSCSTSFDQLRQHTSSSRDDLYKKYLIAFYHFVSNELCISLRMPTDSTSDISSGRNIATIVAFYQSFYYLRTQISDDFKTYDAVFLELIDSVEEYITSSTEASCRINFDQKYNFAEVKKSFFDQLDEKFEDFFDSNQMHDDFEEAKYNYIYGVKPKSLGCIQALIEFFNAMSHILACYITEADESTRTSNIEKAGAHISRGTLDNYKSIIKNGFETLGKSLLRCDEIFGEENPISLVEIRKIEFFALGKPFSSDEKSEVLKGYKGVCQSVINKIAAYPTVKKSNILTNLQQATIVEFITKVTPFDACAMGKFIQSIKSWDIKGEQKYERLLPLWVYLYILIYTEKSRIINIKAALNLSDIRQRRYLNFKKLHLQDSKTADAGIAALIDSLDNVDKLFC